jgi:hypothetical protein
MGSSVLFNVNAAAEKGEAVEVGKKRTRLRRFWI